MAVPNLNKIEEKEERRNDKMNRTEERKGYARKCRNCTTIIWMQLCNDDNWRPFDFPDNTLSGKWENHKENCPGVL